MWFWGWSTWTQVRTVSSHHSSKLVGPLKSLPPTLPAESHLGPSRRLDGGEDGWAPGRGHRLAPVVPGWPVGSAFLSIPPWGSLLHYTDGVLNTELDPRSIYRVLEGVLEMFPLKTKTTLKIVFVLLNFFFF